MKRCWLIALAWGALGCTGAGTEATADALETDRFVDVYVDLRVAALQQSDGEVTPEDRARVLTEHGVEESDLITFAEVHGADAIFMRGVWDSVEVRYQRRRAEMNEEQEAAEN